METRGLGAGSYPDAPIEKYKMYRFEFSGSFTGHGFVYAEDEEEAYALIENGEYFDEEIEVVEITDIENVEEI